jgi:Phospholipase_D-nuclease N-terminal
MSTSIRPTSVSSSCSTVACRPAESWCRLHQGMPFDRRRREPVPPRQLETNHPGRVRRRGNARSDLGRGRPCPVFWTEVTGTVSYPLWDLFLTMLELFVWIVLIVLVVWTILNVLRSDDLSAWAKVGWLVLVIVLPFIGVFAYLIVRGAHLATHQVDTANAPQDEAARRYQRWEAHDKGSAD